MPTPHSMKVMIGIPFAWKKPKHRACLSGKPFYALAGSFEANILGALDEGARLLLLPKTTQNPKLPEIPRRLEKPKTKNCMLREFPYLIVLETFLIFYRISRVKMHQVGNHGVKVSGKMETSRTDVGDEGGRRHAGDKRRTTVAYEG